MRLGPVGLAMSVATAGCATLSPAPLPPHQFLERSYVFATLGDTVPLIYEGQAVAHVLLTDGLADAYNNLSSDSATSAATAWRVMATPMFRIRQLSDSSAAVRTPSYMPRLSAEHLWVVRQGPVGGDQNNPDFGKIRLTGLRATLAHHSNGQAGCFREGFEPADARVDKCKPVPGADTQVVRLNRANGDFSTTFLSLLLHRTWLDRDDDSKPSRSYGAGIGTDLHLPHIFGALSGEQRELYGSWRLRLQAEGMKAFGKSCVDDSPPSRWARILCAARGRSRVTFEGELAPTRSNELANRLPRDIVPYRVSVEASHAFDQLLRAGLFLRVHDGQDYYNIGFVNRRRVVLVGLMLDASGEDRIGKRIVQ